MSKAGKRRNGPVWRLGDCRRLAIDLAIGAGLARESAVALANHLLWFDAANAHDLGIASLPGWLDRVQAGEFRPAHDVEFLTERAATAVVDGGMGVPPLVLFRASAIAGEKAREFGLGLVVVKGLGPAPSAAPQAADLAVGPFAAVVLGPAGAWSLALPSPSGLPAVCDRVFGDDEGPDLAAWAPLVPEDGWLVAAIDMTALGPLAETHERVGRGRGLDPLKWEASRAALHEDGLVPSGKVLKELTRRAEALGVAMPEG